MPLINFSGIASGIDTEGLIKATTDATRTGRVKPIETRVTELTETNDSLTELKAKLNKIRTAIDDFRTINSGGVVKQTTSSAEATVSATASSSASNGSYTINIDQKAQNGVYTFSGTEDTFADPEEIVDASIVDTDPAADRTLTVEIGLGAEKETIAVVLTSTTKWSDVLAAFSSSTKAVASAINVAAPGATPQYRISISSLYEGTDKGTIAVGVGSQLMIRSLFEQFSAVSQAAQNAQFDVAGIGSNIQRATNTITGLIPGVTFTLNNNSGSATINVSDDVPATTTKVQGFIDSWNEFIVFMNENNQITRQEESAGASNTFGTLSKSRVDEGSLSAIRSALSAVSFGDINDGIRYRLVSDLGIETQRDGTLKFKARSSEDTIGRTFQTALETEPNSVKAILSELADSLANPASQNGVIDQYTGFNRLVDQAINANKTSISDQNRRIGEIEAQIARTEASMRARFARLESTIGRLQQQQSQLSSALAGL